MSYIPKPPGLFDEKYKCLPSGLTIGFLLEKLGSLMSKDSIILNLSFNLVAL